MTTAVAHTGPEKAVVPPAQPGYPRVLFACGGTGGHVYPAIAIADAVREIYPEAAIAFAGTRKRMEWEAVSRAGYPIHAVTVSGFQRGFSPDSLRRNMSFPFKLGRGLWDSWQLVGAFDPDVVVGTGGYVSGPVGLAASLRGIPLVLQEQNAYAGATNKMLASRAEAVYVAFEPAREAFSHAKKVTVAGNPIRDDLKEPDLAEARIHFDIPEGSRVLLAMGGSLGAGPVNGAVKLHLDGLLKDERTYVIWSAGSRYFDALSSATPEHERLRLLPYLDRMDLAYAVADLALCRAGAITCSELAATATPAVLVPSPNVAADHQMRNAKALEEAGLVHVILETDLDAHFGDGVIRLLQDDMELSAMSQAAKSIARPDAARTIAEDVIAFALSYRTPDERV